MKPLSLGEKKNCIQQIYFTQQEHTATTADRIGLDCAVFYVPPTQYRLYGRRFLQVKRPNQQYQSTEGNATKENNPENKDNTKYTCIQTKW